MKMTNLFEKLRWVALFCLLAGAFTACGKDDDPEPEPEKSEDITSKIKDPVFLAYCLANFDIDKDGKLRVDEAAAVKEINVSGTAASGKSVKDAGGSKIASLEGLEWFTALEKLFAANNDLTTLDVGKNTKLTVLDAGNNRLTTIDVSKNTILAKLYCNNNQLTGLNIENNTGLTVLVCSGNTGLVFITVWAGFDTPPAGFETGGSDFVKPGEDPSDITAKITDPVFRAYCLENFDSNRDGKLTRAEASAIEEIDVAERGIASLAGIGYFTALKKLTCYANRITSLDMSKNAELTYLECENNLITSLNVSKNTKLETLYCEENELATLDVSNNTLLDILDCSRNRLSALDVSKNTLLGDELDCSFNRLTSLDVSKNTILRWLDCSYNQIASLNVNGDEKLGILYCDNNLLTSIDISGNKKMEGLFCNDNPLSTIWIWSGFDTDNPYHRIPDTAEYKVK